MQENHPLNTASVRAVIVAPVRSGGTFLAHCLSNHPDVYCDRGEPLRAAGVWRPYAEMDRALLLDVMTQQTGYLVSMCKLTYDQAWGEDVWAWIQKRSPRVIWLTRKNLLRQALSQVVNRRVRPEGMERPQHSFEPVAVEPIQVEPAEVMRYIEHFARQNRAAGERLRAMERVPMERVLPVTYEELTGGQEQAEELEPTVGRKLCAFLDVDYAPMPTRLVRIHRGPVAALVSNWRELRDALLQSRYPEVATGEARWSC
jgi:hypothetical protein